MKQYNSESTNSFSINVDQLKGKQSVRATFRLSNQMINLLRVTANHLKVKQKSLIDELIQNWETLNQVACESQDIEQKETQRRQKTFVLSRNALKLLDEVSNKYNISRDYLVECCICRLIPLLNSEQEKHKQRRALLKDIEQYLLNSKELLERADAILEKDDRFRTKLEKIVTHTEHSVTELRKLVQDRKALQY